ASSAWARRGSAGICASRRPESVIAKPGAEVDGGVGADVVRAAGGGAIVFEGVDAGTGTSNAAPTGAKAPSSLHTCSARANAPAGNADGSANSPTDDHA